ncbi:MAG: FkbM family methyltransferase [Verrucomicrobiota bacterium]|nr:FkbM family methyltransferase [Verrucomicrobiota bacterium]
MQKFLNLVIAKLNKTYFLHFVLRTLKIKDILNFILLHCPIKWRIHKKQFVYIYTLESFYTAHEIFNLNTYPLPVGTIINTILDLGSNEGLFCCFATSYSTEQLTGLAIDGNASLKDRIEKNFKANNISAVKFIPGIIGSPDKKGQIGDFFISPYHTSSSVRSVHDTSKPGKGRFKRIQSSYLNVLELWKREMGTKSIDLLKIDIEGTENEFLKNENDILAITNMIVCEVHSYLVDNQETRQLIQNAGFKIIIDFDNDPQTSIIIAQRKR